MNIVVIDAGIGNVGSVMSMLKRIGHRGRLIDAPCRLESDERLILPGVGAFDAGMAALETRGFNVWLSDVAASGTAIMGICLGMQVLFEHSEEGDRSGLGLIPGKVVRLRPPYVGGRLPHMGWNVAIPKRDNPILPLSTRSDRFYFVHSYCVHCANPLDTLAETDYGGPFASVVGRGNLFGVQFHPEKSHRFGMALLERYVTTTLEAGTKENPSSC